MEAGNPLLDEFVLGLTGRERPRVCFLPSASGDADHYIVRSVTSLIGVWRAHGIDAVLREAWESGVILCGLSAGSLCWFGDGVSTFQGRDPE